jgi:hypothetical protein
MLHLSDHSSNLTTPDMTQATANPRPNPGYKIFDGTNNVTPGRAGFFLGDCGEAWHMSPKSLDDMKTAIKQEVRGLHTKASTRVTHKHPHFGVIVEV